MAHTRLLASILTTGLLLACGGSLPIDGTGYFEPLPLDFPRCGAEIASGTVRTVTVYMHRGDGVSETNVATVTRMMAAYWAAYGVRFHGIGYPNPEPFPKLFERDGPLPEAMDALQNSLRTWKKDGLQVLVVRELDNGQHPELAGKAAIGVASRPVPEVWDAILPDPKAAFLFAGIRELTTLDPLNAQAQVARAVGSSLGLSASDDPQNLMASGPWTCLPGLTPEQSSAITIPTANAGAPAGG